MHFISFISDGIAFSGLIKYLMANNNFDCNNKVHQTGRKVLDGVELRRKAASELAERLCKWNGILTV